jgi:hypothetical protein
MEQKDFNKLKKYTDERKLYDEKASKQVGRNKLSGSIKKNITTMMIGAIAAFEEAFGEDWGHGLEDDQRTDEQLDDKIVWNQCRERIMDFGNDLIKRMERELNNYNVEALKYTIKFHQKDNKE